MDTKFQRPNKAALTNAQYFSFITAFSEQLDLANFTPAAVKTRKAALQEQLALVDKYLKIQQGSYLSEDIHAIDSRGDLAYSAAYTVVRAWRDKEFEPQATAAGMLNRVFKLYKINTSAQFDEEWGRMANLLTDLDTPEMKAHIETLGIGVPIQVLGECYGQMKQLIRQRDDELNGKVKGALVQTRKDCDQAYNQMLDIIEAAALMAEDPTPYYEFITRWNTALTRYIQQIIGKKGGSSSGKSSSSSSNGGDGANASDASDGDDETGGADEGGNGNGGSGGVGTITPSSGNSGSQGGSDEGGGSGSGSGSQGGDDNPGGGSGGAGLDE